MNLRVFLSHSVAPYELGIIYAIAEEIAKRGAIPFIPDRNWDPKEEIPDRIFSNLKNANYVLAIATSYGFQIKWLNKEVKEGFKMKKPVLIIADKSIKIPRGINHIWIDRINFIKTLSQVSKYLEKFKCERETKELLIWLTIGGLLFLLFFGSKK
jgi:hypothetical protein